MKHWVCALSITPFLVASGFATTLMMVPVYEPLSLQGTDGDAAVIDVGEALQACVVSRPMVLSGAMPEDLIAAIRSPHLIPTNSPNYKVQEVNLLVLCKILIDAEMTESGLFVRLDVGQLDIPPDVDLTTRQILRLTIIAVRKTLEAYQNPQNRPLNVTLTIEGADEAKATLRELNVQFTLGEVAATP